MSGRAKKVMGVVDPALSNLIGDLTPKKPGAGPVTPMPDEEILKRSKKRVAAGRKGGRASTVMSLGYGGGKSGVGE